MQQGFRQFCPIALASEVLTQRWSLLIIRELLAGSSRFSDIRRGVPRISASLLKTRLETLEQAQIVERRRTRARGIDEYFLTGAGRELEPRKRDVDRRLTRLTDHPGKEVRSQPGVEIVAPGVGQHHPGGDVSVGVR